MSSSSISHIKLHLKMSPKLIFSIRIIFFLRLYFQGFFSAYNCSYVSPPQPQVWSFQIGKTKDKVKFITSLFIYLKFY